MRVPKVAAKVPTVKPKGDVDTKDCAEGNKGVIFSSSFCWKSRWNSARKWLFWVAVKVANSGIKRLERLFTEGHWLKAQLQAGRLPSKLADYNKQFSVFAEFLDKFRTSVATAGKLSWMKTGLWSRRRKFLSGAASQGSQ